MKTIDIFAGGGGLSLGFKNAGYNIVAAFDNWQPAIKLYKGNFTEHPVLNFDLSSNDAMKNIKDISPEIIIGGPPCQDFSSAGKRNENLGRADLTITYAKIIKNIKPHYFVMENVDRALKSNAFKEAVSIFKKSKYGLTIKIINACHCGIPQARKRLFVIGELGGKDNFLLQEIESNLSDKKTTLKDYFGNSLGIEYYYRHPRSYKRRGIFSIDEPSPTIRGVNRPIPKGYKGHPGDRAPISDKIRPLTTKERSLIQTYPQDFKLIGCKTDIEQIIGNAVPVKLAEYIASCLKNYIRNKNERQNNIATSVKET